MKSPAFSFYVRDWLCSNTVSKLHSKALSKSGSNLYARGVNAYLFLLLQSWIQEPSCTLPDDDVELADLARVSTEEWEVLKVIIRPAFQKDTTGRLFNERLMQEHDKQQKRKASGGLGGVAKALAKSIANPVAALENEIEIENGFRLFWEAYPKKVSKPEALKAFIKSVPKFNFDKMMAALERQKRDPNWIKEKGQFVPNPASWLNQEKWNDEPYKHQTPSPSTNGAPKPLRFLDRWTPENPPKREQFPNERSFEYHRDAFESWCRGNAKAKA